MLAVGERFGSLHGLIGQAAILAVLLAILVAFRGLLTEKGHQRHPPWLLEGGLVATVFLSLTAAMSGRFAGFAAAQRFLNDELVAGHQRLGIAATWLCLAAVVVTLWRRGDRRQRALSVGLWSATAVTTWLCVRGGIALARLDDPPRATARELANLSLRYHPDDIPLIGTLHLIGGSFLILLALASWLSQRNSKVLADRSQVLCSCCAVALGVALVMWGAPDAWPAGEERPLSDAGIFGLRLYSLLLLLSGLAIALVARHGDRKALRQQIWAGAALLGGVTLITSEQTTAPFSHIARHLYLTEQAIGTMLAGGAGVRLGCFSRLGERSRRILWVCSLAAAGGILLWSGGQLSLS